MSETRREFIGGGLIACGAVGAGLLASKVIRKLNKPEKLGPLVPALTAQGQLVHVDMESGAAHAHAAAHGPLTGEAARQGVPGRKWVMVIDLAKCSGCANCSIECSRMHGTPPDRQWIRVFKMQDGPNTAPYWFPKPCFHCDNPPCTKVCPVGATFKRQDGIVLIDNERCIGCRFCMAACPYSTRSFNWGRPDNSQADVAYSPETGVPRRIGTVEKCDFCPEMARQGILPGCVTSCDMAAIYFGDQNEDAVSNSEETVRFSQLLQERAGYQYLAELGTEPRVYYLPPANREFPGPAKPKLQKPAARPAPHDHAGHAHHKATT
jgi:Fe-S-cluster-containing dehydrogenase component